MRQMVVLFLVCLAVFAFAAVKVEKVGDDFAVTGDIYTAKVTADGALNSLVINGVEFMAPATPLVWNEKYVLPGVYAAPMNQYYKPYKMPGNAVGHDNVVRAEGNGWWIEYTFLPDAVEFSYFGAPEGGRGFRAGYPPAELYLSLSHDLHRACDPENQGELGWPVNRPHEPGNFTILAPNGAGFTATDVCRIQGIKTANNFPVAPNRLDVLVFNTYDQTQKPITHRLQLFTKADLAHSLTMEITSPNPDHIFPRGTDVSFPVKVTVLYGNTLKGTLAFTGAPYVWKTPKVEASVPLALTPEQPTATVQLPITPPKPSHYIGRISVTDGKTPLYSQRLGFLYRPAEIPAAPPPADFDAFWDNTMAELAKIPLDLTLEPQPKLETPHGIVYKAKYRSWGGRWAWAWLTVPKKEGKFPAQITCPPVSVWQPPPPGPANGALHIAVAIHGGDLADYPAKPDFDYMNTGITDRETYMLRYSYCCLARCYDIIRAQESCNGEVHVFGSSQGGGLSLVMAGLRPVTDVRGIAIALCRIDWTVLGYTEWGPGCPKGEDPKKIAEVARYYDPANFAHRVKSPLRLGFGVFDQCAPAEGIFTFINGLPKETKCEVFIDPYGGHFTYNATRFNSGQPGLEVPRWFGTDADNKLNKQ